MSEGQVPPVDAFHGQGGAYVVDPETGERVLASRTLSREEAAEQKEGGDHGAA